MRKIKIKSGLAWVATLSFLVLANVALSVAAEEKRTFTKNQRAFYLSEQELSFIRPGLVFKIQEASIDQAGVVRYTFTITDPAGLPLDRNGVFTPGPVSVSSVIATIPADQDQYVAYTTRIQTENGRSEEQATSDSGGIFEDLGEGRYRYTFATRAPSGFNARATHTVAAWASHNLSEFDLGTDLDSDTFDFVPDGSAVTKVRDVVADKSCNSCHGRLVFHGSRTGVKLCVTCHTPQTTDPGSNNTVDFKVMVHKIHAGEHLPSVQAGNPYFIIGFRGRTVDYSDVVFPPDLRVCETCHTQDEEPTAVVAEAVQPAAPAHLVPLRSRGSQHGLEPVPFHQSQGNRWLTNPGRAQCGSCHDDVNFDTGENHAGLPQPSDSQCARCHIPEGEIEYDLSIKGSHTVEIYSKELPGTNFDILNIQDTGPGQNPTVTFSIKDDAGNPIAPSDVSRLTLYLAGDTRDHMQWWGEGASGAQGSGGTYNYTFEQPIPEDATGSWSVGIEGQVPRTILAGTEQERNVNDAGRNVVKAFPVTDSEAKPRRTVVTQEKCASCHVDFSLHGGPRKEVAFCVTCHIPSQTDAARRPEEQMPPESVNFKDMIHRIHGGMRQNRDFTIFGFGGTPHNYNNVRYPNDLRNCEACHVNGSQNLPLAEGALPSTTARDLFFDLMPPETGACLSCHTSSFAAAHADVNISDRLGESCATCHGEGSTFSVDRVHAR